MQGPFGLDRPLVKSDEGFLGVERPFVEPQRASYVQHNVTRDSAAKVAYQKQIKQERKRHRLEELNNELEGEKAELNMLQKRFDTMVLSMRKDRLAEEIRDRERDIDRIEQEINDVKSGESTRYIEPRNNDYNSISLYEIEDALEDILEEAALDVGISTPPVVKGGPETIEIYTRVSNITARDVEQLTNEYEDLGLMVTGVEFR